MKSKYLLIGMCLCITACLKVEKYKVPSNFQKQFVLHAFISPDSALSWASFTSPLNQPDFPIEDASLSLKINNQNAKFLTQNANKTYTANKLNANQLDSVFFTCSHPTTTFVIADRFPNKPRILKVDTFSAINPPVGKTLNFNIKIKDTAAFDNFYRLFLTLTSLQYIYDYQNQLIDSFIKTEIVSIFGRGLAFEQNNYNKYTTNEILFTDATFNGVNQQLTFYSLQNFQQTSFNKPLYLTLNLQGLSPSLFKYFNNRNAHLWQQQSIVQAPSILTGNLNPIIGVFGLFNAQTIKINL